MQRTVKCAKCERVVVVEIPAEKGWWNARDVRCDCGAKGIVGRDSTGEPTAWGYMVAKPSGVTLDRLTWLLNRVASRDGSVVVGLLAGQGSPTALSAAGQGSPIALSAVEALEKLDGIGRVEAEDLLAYLESILDTSATCPRCGHTVQRRRVGDIEVLAHHVRSGGGLCPASGDEVDPAAGERAFVESQLAPRATLTRPGPGQSLDLQEGPEDVLAELAAPGQYEVRHNPVAEEVSVAIRVGGKLLETSLWSANQTARALGVAEAILGRMPATWGHTANGLRRWFTTQGVTS